MSIYQTFLSHSSFLCITFSEQHNITQGLRLTPTFSQQLTIYASKMAEAPKSLELLLSCQVCFEEFTEDGAHVPRLLPCTHTLCHSCIGRMIQDRKLECPECRVKHEAKNEEKSFPQNKYILSQLKRKLNKRRILQKNLQDVKNIGRSSTYSAKVLAVRNQFAECALERNIKTIV